MPGVPTLPRGYGLTTATNELAEDLEKKVNNRNADERKPNVRDVRQNYRRVTVRRTGKIVNRRVDGRRNRVTRRTDRRGASALCGGRARDKAERSEERETGALNADENFVHELIHLFCFPLPLELIGKHRDKPPGRLDNRDANLTEQEAAESGNHELMVKRGIKNGHFREGVKT